MQFHVNGKPADPQPDVNLKPDERMRELGQTLYHEGMLIVNVEADGKDVTGLPYEEWQLEQEPARINLLTQTPAELMGTSLKVSREWLGPLGTELRTCADRFRMGEEAQAIESLLKVIDGLQLLMAGINQIERLFRSLRPEVDLAELESFQQKLMGMLDEVIKSQEGRDWILLADLLEYDIAESLDDWDQVTHMLLDALQ